MLHNAKQSRSRGSKAAPKNDAAYSELLGWCLYVAVQFSIYTSELFPNNSTYVSSVILLEVLWSVKVVFGKLQACYKVLYLEHCLFPQCPAIKTMPVQCLETLPSSTEILKSLLLLYSSFSPHWALYIGSFEWLGENSHIIFTDK